MNWYKFKGDNSTKGCDNSMEYILGVGILALLGSKFIKNIMGSMVFIAVIVISIAITITYKLPYLISLSICILVKYGLSDSLVNIKSLGKSIIKSKKRYNNGYLQKLVSILANCNYLLFTLLCYIFLVNELINQNITSSLEETILICIIVVITIKILRKICNYI